jgi:hypothetical protein
VVNCWGVAVPFDCVPNGDALLCGVPPKLNKLDPAAGAAAGVEEPNGLNAGLLDESAAGVVVDAPKENKLLCFGAAISFESDIAESSFES